MSAKHAMVIVATAVLGMGCVSHPEVQEVPPSIRLQEGRFVSVTSSGRWTDLMVMMSTTDLCDKSKIEGGQLILTVRVEVALGQDVVPGAYPVGDSAPGGVVLSTANQGCSGGTGAGSSFGTVSLTTVSAQTVEGSFDAWGTEMHLFGSFRATPCPKPSDTCFM